MRNIPTSVRLGGACRSSPDIGRECEAALQLCLVGNDQNAEAVALRWAAGLRLSGDQIGRRRCNPIDFLHRPESRRWRDRGGPLRSPFSRGGVRHQTHQHLAVVGTPEEVDEGGGSIFETVDHGFADFDLPRLQPTDLPILQFFMQTDLFRVAVFPGFTYAALIAAVTIFVERKFLARMQLRVGPLYAGKIEGILQLLADGLKLMSKEIIVPSGADKPIFWAAPIAFVATAAAVTALIPAAPGWVVADLDVGIIAVFAIFGFFPLIALLFSWASNSKYPFIGGLRALHQMIAFEIPFILSALSVVLLISMASGAILHSV